MDTSLLLPADALPAPERAGVYRAILTRRDTRGEFLPEDVPDAILSRVLIAAHHAPSVGFMQPWNFIVIRDREVRRRIHDAFLKAHAEAAMMFPENQRDFYRSLKLEGIMESPMNVCVTCERGRAGPIVIGRTHVRTMDLYSSVCAVQNFWLAARAEGLGVGWVSIFDIATVRAVLNMPKGVVPVAYLCVGKVRGFHPRPELEASGWRARLPLDRLIHFDQWGGQRADDGLLRHVRDDQRAVGEGRFVGA